MKGRGAILDRLAAEGRLRQLLPISGRSGPRIQLDGKTLYNLSSNDYLGLGGDHRLLSRFYREMDDHNRIDRFAPGSTSSRLLAGDCPAAHAVENRLGECYRGQRGMGDREVLLFNSGYHANTGILPALYGRRDLIVADRLNHASLVDGARLSRARVKRFAHCDYDHLRSLLVRFRGSAERAVIVSESVFSMDGDVADLIRLVQLKEEFACELCLDEAHAFGLFGRGGLGRAVAAGVADRVELLVGVFGKALASQGSFVVCSRQLRQLLTNSARSFLFTTGLPPVIHSWNLFAVEQMLGMETARRHLQNLGRRLRSDLRAHGLETGGDTAIVPVIIGDDSETVRRAARMRQLGWFILPVRPPTVPPGTSRFRLSLTAAMRWQELTGLAAGIAGERGQ